MADETDDGRTFEPISTTTLGSLGRGMVNRARTQGTGIARQLAQNYEDIARAGRDALPRGTLGPTSGRAPWEARPAEMTESPFAQASSDPGVRLGAQLVDPMNYALGAGGLGAKAVKQAATSRALRAGERAAEAEQALAKKSAEWIATPPGLASREAGFISPKYAGALGGGGLAVYGLSRLLRGGKTEPPDDPTARTTANAFRQQQEAMDAAQEELRRQNSAPGLRRMEAQLEREGK